MNDQFRNKIAVIAGGAGGIGKGIALKLGSQGATVILLDCNEVLLQETLKVFEAAEIRAAGFMLDISSEQEVRERIADICRSYERIDILVNSAGIVGPTSTKITEYSAAEFDQVCRVNLRGSFLITKYVLKEMEKTGKGRILLIASIAGKDGNPGMAGYTASKAGMIGLVKGVAKEFAETNITINGLAPAVIKTPMNDDTSAEQMAYMTAKIPMKRLGTVEEAAALCSFIVSEENSFSTGFIYDLSGGRATY